MRIHARRLENNPRFLRRGVAAVEMAIVAPVLMSFLMGLWEVGRYIMIQNVLDSAAREGARLAASGGYFSSNNQNSNTTPSYTIVLPPPSTNSNYEVQTRVQIYLEGMGITTTGMTVTVANVGTSGNPKSWSYTWNQAGGSSGSGYDPSAAANQLDQLNITVTLPYKNEAWSPLSWFISQSATMNANASWLSMSDYPVTVTATIPSEPLTSSSTLP